MYTRIQNTILVVALLIADLSSFGQTGLIPFKLLVLRPDTTIIDKSYNTQKDSFELSQIKSDLECRNISIDSLTAIKKSIPSGFQYSSVDLYSLESLKQIIDYKYYYFLSEYSAQTYEFLFNNYNQSNGIPAMAHDVTAVEMVNQKTDRRSLKLLADSVKADYIVYFKNIQTVKIGSSLSLQMSTSLYSRKENKVISSFSTIGDHINRGQNSGIKTMWRCQAEFSCLLVNSIKGSVEKIVDVIRKLQRRE